MTAVFYISGIVALVASLLVITRRNAVHAVLYLVVSLLATALVFFSLGAPFAGVLEIIIYAGAIMVFFIFVVMLLNLGPDAEQQERRWMQGSIWIGPAVLGMILAAELAYVIAGGATGAAAGMTVGPKDVATTMFGTYALGVELASFLLLAGLVGAYHIGRGLGARDRAPEEQARGEDA
ncbi:MAG: NADH-quinone oxidoreductase subunit J [Candidatus Eisenbacteria bacterium]|nr:NADH-quinone oxidoreductase subunit J [Candidatus Eisenbacteria bacterium]